MIFYLSIDMERGKKPHSYSFHPMLQLLSDTPPLIFPFPDESAVEPEAGLMEAAYLHVVT